MSFLPIVVKKRVNVGTRFNIKLCKKGKIPGILYSKKTSTPIFCDDKDFFAVLKMISKGINLIKCKIDDDIFFVVLKDFHKHPCKDKVLHFDFQKVVLTDTVTIKIILKFFGETKSSGLKQGGYLIKYISSALIRSVASNIPDYIYVNLSNLNINQSIFLSDLILPKGITFPLLSKKNKSDLLVASIVGSKINESK